MLDRDAGAQERVLGGVGQQAEQEFRNLVGKLTDTSVQIQDINVGIVIKFKWWSNELLQVRTLYYTILNFAKIPVTASMRQFEPLSNFALRVEPLLDLRRLLEKDPNIQDVLRRHLGGTEVERFLSRTVRLQKEKKDFVLEKQEENIIMYHRLRNSIIDNLMSRLGKVHAKIKQVTLKNPPATFNIAVAMLESLMATHYNGQVLMMEKSKFDFDFLSTILSYLQQQTNQGGPQSNEVPIVPPKDDTVVDVKSIKKELQNESIYNSVKQLLGEEVLEGHVKVLASMEQSQVAPNDLATKRVILGLKNAVFMCKNKILCSDLPLSNIQLEVSKFSKLVKFVSKDAGIKTAISLKYGEIALKELEALVMAHEERGDLFVTKFVDKNTSLYHGLRNTALEKILRQMGVVHGKVRHISLSSSAMTPEYQVAIKTLDSIVYAELPQKIKLIEEMNFEFDFLSTILMVWKTETSRQAEETRREEERRRAEEERARVVAREAARRRELEEMPVESFFFSHPFYFYTCPGGNPGGERRRPRAFQPAGSSSPEYAGALPVSPSAIVQQQVIQLDWIFSSRHSVNDIFRRQFTPTRSQVFQQQRPPLPLPPPPKIASAADPMPVDPKAASELPIR